MIHRVAGAVSAALLTFPIGAVDGVASHDALLQNARSDEFAKLVAQIAHHGKGADAYRHWYARLEQQTARQDALVVDADSRSRGRRAAAYPCAS